MSLYCVNIHLVNASIEQRKIKTEDKSELIIRMEGPTFMTLKRSLRVTSADKLGSIGGTLGLFSGFSLLAIMELIHWICKIINSIFDVKSYTFNIASISNH